MLSDSPTPGQGDHRGCVLYRMRVSHLGTLARLLDEAGHLAIVTEPPGMPILHIGRRTGAEPWIVATLGYGDVDWYRWCSGQEQPSGDYIAPCSEPQVAAQELLAALWGVSP